MNYSHSRAVDRGRLISPVFQIIIGLDFVARYPARSVSELWFDWGGGEGEEGEIVAKLRLRSRPSRDGTLRTRRNAHRNERLTRVGVEGKMPIEPPPLRKGGPANG